MQKSTVYFPKVDLLEEKLSMFEIATYDMHRNKVCMRASSLAKKHVQQFFSQTQWLKLENKLFKNRVFYHNI